MHLLHRDIISYIKVLLIAHFFPQFHTPIGTTTSNLDLPSISSGKLANMWQGKESVGDSIIYSRSEAFLADLQLTTIQ